VIRIKKIRKRDYIITLIILLIIMLPQLFEPTPVEFLIVIISSIVEALIVGTISNKLIPSKKSK